MDGVYVDYLVVFFALVFYAFLAVVYLLRAHRLEATEWRLSVPFSLQLIPFTLLWATNLLIGNDSGRLIVGLPIIVYLVYDLWYRLITQNKPYHHPERWPIGLVIYLLLLFAASIGLNWYGYLVSNLYGNILVVAFFIMMGSFGYYQVKYNRQKKANPSSQDRAPTIGQDYQRGRAGFQRQFTSESGTHKVWPRSGSLSCRFDSQGIVRFVPSL